MPLYRCPHPVHTAGAVPLKSNNDRVFECEVNHRFYRRQEGDATVLVDLISSDTYPAEAMEEEADGGRRQLNFMTDVPRIKGSLDFDRLSLSAPEWKLLSKVDGRSTLEEVRLLASLRAEEAEKIIVRFMDDGLLEIRGRR
jgi:hypothetical protein